MATQVQFRGGTTTEHSSFTGVAKEVTVDTTKKTLVVHDGATVGGVPLATEAAVNGKVGLTGNETVAGTKTFSSTITGSITGNAGTVTNGVYTSGDQTIGGVKTLSSNPIVNAGTANGVAFLNSSKVLTTGSVLTFDGSRLSLGGGTNGSRFSVRGAGAVGGFDTGAAADGRIEYAYNGTNIFYTGMDSASLMTLMARSGVSLAFGANGSEQMRLTSTGLGIGTSSPSAGAKLTVTAGASSIVRLFNNNQTTGQFEIGQGFASGSDNISYLYNFSNAAMVFGTNAIERMRLDSSGNLGLGVTPSAWGSSFKAMQISGNGLAGTNSQFQISQNAYTIGSAIWNYLSTAAATRYTQESGVHSWHVAPSGTAGNAISFTQAMTLDASGNLGLGTTSIAYATANRTEFDINGSVSSVIAMKANNTVYGALTASASALSIENPTANPITFNTNGSERARIDSSGDFAVGQAPTTSINQVAGVTISPSGYTQIQRSAGNPLALARFGSSTGTITQFFYNATSVGSISITASATAYNTSSDYRLKDNPQPLTGSGAFIDALQPKTWDWKVDGSKGVGFLAHEAQAVSPSSVAGEKDAVNEEGKPIMQAMEYGSAEFIANIIAELQSLRARVQALESN